MNSTIGVYSKLIQRQDDKNSKKHINYLVKKCSYAIILSSIIGICNASDIVYVDMNNKLQRNMLSTDDLDLSAVSADILNNNKKYLIDFSKIKSVANSVNIKKQFYKANAISFNNDLMIISRYKNHLMYTPTTTDDLDFAVKEASKASLVTDEGFNNKNSQMPNITNYVNIIKKIPSQDCSFPSGFNNDNVRNPNPVQMNFCKNPHISLKYQVYLARSLGNGTANTKNVRFSLDSSAGTGVGIALNAEGLWEKIYWTKDFRNGGGNPYKNHMQAVYTGAAIAKDYRFNISASNDLTSISKADPENLNTSYSNSYSTGIKFGITARPSISKNPSFDVVPSADHMNVRTLSFTTQDYKVVKSAISPQQVRFEWIREHNKDSKDLLWKTYSTAVRGEVDKFPWDLKRIRPIAYKGFVPHLDVAFITDPMIKGETTFNLNEEITIQPIYAAAWLSPGLIPLWYKYNVIEQNLERTFKHSQTLSINWDHPVFQGGWPVDLRLNDTDRGGHCLEVDHINITQQECANDLSPMKKAISQSFFYDVNHRYRSISDISLCLDAANLSELAPCTRASTQSWEWDKKNNVLMNQYLSKILAYDKKTGALSLYDSKEKIPSTHSASINSVFMSEKVFK